MISRTSAYALEAALVIARAGETPVRAAQIADQLDLPANYLSKILHALARNGVLQSERGPSGGFRLGRSAGEVRINDILAEFEDVGEARRCLLGRGSCSDEDSCPMHRQWKSVSAPVFEFFRTTTLADLLTGTPAKASPRSRRPRASTRKRRSR